MVLKSEGIVTAAKWHGEKNPVISTPITCHHLLISTSNSHIERNYSARNH